MSEDCLTLNIWAPAGARAAPPHPAKSLMPGMYRLNEEVVCRGVAAGNQPWNWNFGLWSPTLPPMVPQCRSA